MQQVWVPLVEQMVVQEAAWDSAIPALLLSDLQRAEMHCNPHRPVVDMVTKAVVSATLHWVID
jgi:hypothetical protein